MAASVINFQYREVIYYPIVVTTVIEPGMRFMQVMVNITIPGEVVCAAFSPSIAPNTVLDIQNNGNASATFARYQIATVYLGRLSPDTTYAVYCFTKDFSVNSMPLSAVSRFVVKTLCCKKVFFPVTYPSIPEQVTLPQPQYQVGLDSPPTQTTQIALSIAYKTCPASLNLGSQQLQKLQAVVTVPVVFTFIPSSSSLTANFVVQGFQGCYTLTAYVVSGSSYKNVSTMVVIQNANAVPPLAPKLTSVDFASDGLSVLFSFNAATNMPSPTGQLVFACNLLVRFFGADKATCVWTSGVQLAASLIGKFPDLGSGAAIYGGLVRAACITGSVCSSYPTAPMMFANISIPANPVMPVISLIAPTTFRYLPDRSASIQWP